VFSLWHFFAGPPRIPSLWFPIREPILEIGGALLLGGQADHFAVVLQQLQRLVRRIEVGVIFRDLPAGLLDEGQVLPVLADLLQAISRSTARHRMLPANTATPDRLALNNQRNCGSNPLLAGNVTAEGNRGSNVPEGNVNVR
jgi:hypothetical protein